MKKSAMLRKSIMERRALVVPGAHDALSAKVIETAGFEAVQVSGYGLAGSYLGLPDVGLLQFKDMLEINGNIADAVGIPVMADLDTGGGNAINAAENTKKMIARGVAGMNIEDQVFPKRCGHMSGKTVIPAVEMEGKIRACSDARNQVDRDFIINARTDVFAIEGIDEAIRRCNLYLRAGADLVFIDGISSKADVEKAVKEVEGPLSVNLMDAVSGMKTELIPVPELARMGVARVSIPVASIMVAHKSLTDFFNTLKSAPEGILPGQTQWVCSFEEYTDFVGLKAYKKLEDRYLPKEVLDSKYQGQTAIVG